MYIGIGIVAFLMYCLGFFVGRKAGFKMSGIKGVKMQEDIDNLTVSKNLLLKQLKYCRERSAERRDQNDELKEELYAYKKRYGGLD